MDSTVMRSPEPIMRAFPPCMRLSANRYEGDGNIQGYVGCACRSSVYAVSLRLSAGGSVSAYVFSTTPEQTLLTPPRRSMRHLPRKPWRLPGKPWRLSGGTHNNEICNL